VGRGRVAMGRLMRIGAIFPGQGSQRLGMGGSLATASPEVADLFARARALLGYDLAEVLERGPGERLRETHVSQPAIFVVNYALAVLRPPALEIVVTAGHSFAEFCSLTLAGSFGFEAALRLVIERGAAMHDAATRVPGAMFAVLGLGETQLRAAVARARADGGVVQLANFNSPAQIVISGEAAAVARAGAYAREAGAKKVVPLGVTGAWHSELMRPARERFEVALAEVAIALPRVPVISNVDGEPYTDVETIRRNLGRSVTDEVRWHRTSERLLAASPDALVEFGGSAVLAPLAKRLPGAPRAVFAGDPAAVAGLAAELAAEVAAG